ncbi:MAG TPA: hypothetical protein VKW08_26025 [Xanthobacteraceae bacterium]|nr:hypothetical protein [Xanthobacteraceae bacterium]
MKLTSAQVQETLTQYDGQPIPDDHRLLPPLNERYGDHTFFLDSNGLNILERTASAADSRTAQIVNLADWADANCTKLVAHDPEPTDTFVAIEMGRPS